MPASACRRFFIILPAVALAACSGTKKLDLGGQCLLNTDCSSPLICSMGSCHTGCLDTRDCPAGQGCVKTIGGSVCQLPAEADCRALTCAGGLVCAVDYRCRAACQSPANCTSGQVCVTNVCADPTDLDTNGQLPQKNPNAAVDGGRPADAGATPPDAGLDVPADGGPAVALDAAVALDLGGPDRSPGPETGPLDLAAADVATPGDLALDMTDTAADGGGGSTILTGCSKPVVGTRYFCDDFESGLSQWMVATNGWNTVSTTYQSPNHAITDSPNEDYTQATNNEITMAVSVDLTTAVAPVLTFWQILKLAGDSHCSGGSVCLGCGVQDSAYVEASSDGGTTWSKLACMTLSSGSSTWSFQQLSLSGFVGKKTKIRFHLWDNSQGSQADGWYLDDITIQEAN
jgi:hypothetical protein